MKYIFTLLFTAMAFGLMGQQNAYKIAPRDYKDRGISDQPSIKIDGEGVILAKFNVSLGIDNPLNELGAEKGLILKLSSKENKPLANVTCPCTIKKVRKKTVKWLCKGQIGDIKTLAEMVEYGMIPRSEDNLTNQRRKEVNVLVPDYENISIGLKEGDIAEQLLLPETSEGMDYTVNYPVNYVKSARRRRKDRGYRAKSGIVVVNVYSSGAERIIHPTPISEAVVATFISEKGEPFDLKLNLEDKDDTDNVLNYKIKLSLEEYDKYFIAEDYTISLKYGDIIISGVPLKFDLTSDTPNFRVINPTSTSLSEGIVAYPNPTHNNMKLNLGGTYSQVRVLITNLTGQVISDRQLGEVSNAALELGDQAGIYLIQVFSKDQQIAKIKAVKE